MSTDNPQIISLGCERCGEQLHRLVYVHDQLLTITCERCGRTTKMPKDLVLGRYILNFPGRIGRLHTKVLSGVAHRPVRFTLTLPIKAVNKVGQVLHEIRQIARS